MRASLLALLCLLPGAAVGQTASSPIRTLVEKGDGMDLPWLSTWPIAVERDERDGFVLAYQGTSPYTAGGRIHMRVLGADLGVRSDTLVTARLFYDYEALRLERSHERFLVTYGLYSYLPRPYVQAMTIAEGKVRSIDADGTAVVSDADLYNAMDVEAVPSWSTGLVAYSGRYEPSSSASGVPVVRVRSLQGQSASIYGHPITVASYGARPRLTPVSTGAVLVYATEPAKPDVSAAAAPHAGLWVAPLRAGGAPAAHPIRLTEDGRVLAAHEVAASGDTVLVVWQQADAGTFNLYGRLLARTGTPIGDAFAVSTAPGDQVRPTVGVRSDGAFVVVWEDRREDGHPQVYAQTVSKTGRLLGSSAATGRRLSDGARGQFPAVTRDGVLVAWVQDGPGRTAVKGRLETGEAAPALAFVGTPLPGVATVVLRAVVRHAATDMAAEVRVTGPAGLRTVPMAVESDSTYVVTLSDLTPATTYQVEARLVGTGVSTGVVSFTTQAGGVLPASGLPATSYVSRLLVLPSGAALAAVWDMGLYRFDGGAWRSAYGYFPVRNVTDLASPAGAPETLFATTWDSGVWTSTDAGLTWNREALPPLFEQTRAVVVRADGVPCVSGQGGFACRLGTAWTVVNGETRLSSMVSFGGGIVGAMRSEVRVSHDGGATWSLSAAPGGTVNALAVTPGGTWLAATDRGLFSTADAGATWRRVALPDPTKDVKAVAVDAASGIVYVTYGRGTIVQVSADLGHATVIGEAEGALALALTPSGRLLVGTAAAGLTSLETGGVTDADVPAVGRPLAVRVAPTPTRGAALVTVVGADDGALSVGVFDVLGRQVATFTTGGSQGSVALPALPAGVYVIRATQGARHATTRHVVQR